MITSIDIDSSEALADGRIFGAAGAYVRMVGSAYGEVDQGHPGNSGIADIDKAACNGRGKVEYAADVFILRPADPAKGNGRILHEVNNRGHKRLFCRLAGGAEDQNEMRDMDGLGTAFLLTQGYTVVWSGWDATVPRNNARLSIDVPVATENGRSIVSPMRDELVTGTRDHKSDEFRLTYGAASLDKSKARLTVRRYQSDAPKAIPEDDWGFVDARTIRLLPAGTKPQLGSLYELRFLASNPLVLGLGYAATRDIISYLRYEPAGKELLGGAISHTLSIGFSQSGRFLRDFTAQGFNKDETGQRVFDGLLAHTGGSGRVFFNQRFGQPNRTGSRHQDHDKPESVFPFSTASLTNPISGETASLFPGDPTDPLMMSTNTSTEYWQKGASLIHTDPMGTADVALPDNSRVYLIAGTQHNAHSGAADALGPCANPRNPHSPMPVLRALLAALDEWVVNGRPPPDSCVPLLADSGLVTPDMFAFPAIPGAKVPSGMNEIGPLGDWLDPKTPTQFYRPLVPAIDADGNETGGVRLPDIIAPLATYTGWNIFKAPLPDGELADRDGSCLPFAATPEAAQQAGDPRPSIAERYQNRAAYVAMVKAAADDLVRQRLLLPEDATAYVDKAKADPRLGA